MVKLPSNYEFSFGVAKTSHGFHFHDKDVLQMSVGRPSKNVQFLCMEMGNGPIMTTTKNVPRSNRLARKVIGKKK